jgi:hypothetical protein
MTPRPVIIKRRRGARSESPEPPTPPIGESLSMVGVRYSSTPYSYMTTSAAWSDTGTITAASKTIAIITILPDTVEAAMNANLGIHITPKGAPLSRKILVKEAATFDVLVFDWDTIFKAAIDNGGSLNTPPTPELRLSSVQGQALTYDSVSGLIIEWTTANTIRMMNTSGTVIENLPIANSGLVSGTCYYRYDTGDLFLADDTNVSPRRYRKVNGAWTLQEVPWFVTGEGITYDYPGSMIVVHGNQRIRSQDANGFNSTMMLPNPILGMNTVAEGLAIDPKLRVSASCADMYWHGSIVGGNRITVQDIYDSFQQILYMPHDIRFSDMSGGTVTGQYNTEVLSSADWVEMPVIDFGSDTGQQNLSNWFGTQYYDIEFRGSSTSPTTTVTDNLYSKPFYKNGWGSTSPDSYSSSPSLFRYVQPRIKPKAYNPPSTWTPANLSPPAYIWSDMTRRVDAFGQDRMDFYADGGDAPVANNFRIHVLANRATPSNKWTQSSGTFRPLWDSVNKYVVGIVSTSNRHFILDNYQLLTGLSSCDVHVIMRRVTNANNCIFLSVSDSASNNNKLILQWLASSGTIAHGISIDYIDGSGNRSLYGVADTSTTWKLITFRLGGSQNSILVNKVPMALTVNTGSNTGQCFDDIAAGANGARMGRVQATTSVNGAQDFKFLLVTPQLSDGDLDNLYNYVTNLGMI